MCINIVKVVKKLKPEVTITLLYYNVSDETTTYKIKRAKYEGDIDALFYEYVSSDYLAILIKI